jgi:hypothetical protein
VDVDVDVEPVQEMTRCNVENEKATLFFCNFFIGKLKEKAKRSCTSTSTDQFPTSSRDGRILPCTHMDVQKQCRAQSTNHSEPWPLDQIVLHRLCESL